jgi:hypothetical protein
MWSPAAVTGVISGLTSLVVAITVLVRQLRHQRDPGAHSAPPAEAPQGPGQA